MAGEVRAEIVAQTSQTINQMAFDAGRKIYNWTEGEVPSGNEVLDEILKRFHSNDTEDVTSGIIVSKSNVDAAIRKYFDRVDETIDKFGWGRFTKEEIHKLRRDGRIAYERGADG